MGMPLSISGNTTVPSSSGASQYGITQAPTTVVDIGGSENIAAILAASAQGQLSLSNGSSLNVLNSQMGGGLDGAGGISAVVNTPVGSVSVGSTFNWTYILVGGAAIAFFIWYSRRK